MSKDEVSRRVVLGAIGIGAASAAAVGGLPRAPARTDAASGQPNRIEAHDSTRPLELFAPLAVGSTLGRWKIEQTLPVQDGAASVVLCDTEQRRFQLDVCAFDPDAGASRAPGRSELFEVFLANLGDGDTITHEEHGLAAMALAELIRANEHWVDRSGFQTLRQRVEARRARRHVT
jgi:hypothetical protein